MKKIYRFTASWCNPCKMLAKTLENHDLDVEIVVVDIDENRELCEKFNIRGVPTLVDPETGAALVGNKTLDEIRNWLSE